MQSPEHWRKPGEGAPRRSPSRSPSHLATPDNAPARHRSSLEVDELWPSGAAPAARRTSSLASASSINISFPEGAATSRLAELQGTGGGDIEMGGWDSDDSDDEEKTDGREFMAAFFREVDEVKDGIHAVQRATRKIERITNQRTMSVDEDEDAKLSRALGPLVERTNARIKATRDALQRMSEENEKQDNSGDARIRDNLVQTMTRKFGDVCRDWSRAVWKSHLRRVRHLLDGVAMSVPHRSTEPARPHGVAEKLISHRSQAQEQHKEEIQGNVRRQLEIVKPDVTDEEIDTVLRADGSSNRVMRSAILRNSADPIKDAYAHAADRYQDVLKLEQSVAELHQLFLDFALLTEQQGEALDQIEYQVRAAGEYVESGNADIRYAIKYQTELRRRYCCCCVIVLVVLAVILIYLAVTNPRLFKKIK